MAGDTFFDPAVAEYVRGRLAAELVERGAAVRLAEATGFSRMHISLVSRGKKRAGSDLALALAKHWRLSQRQLFELAHDKDEAKQAPTHPELDAMLAFVAPLYPREYLSEFDVEARRGPDRPRLDWYTEIQRRFRVWVVEQPKSLQLKSLRLLGGG